MKEHWGWGLMMKRGGGGWSRKTHQNPQYVHFNGGWGGRIEFQGFFGVAFFGGRGWE
jgi:hypothetical protein